MNDKIKKPPLGIMPRFIHESQRIEEIITSIQEHIKNAFNILKNNYELHNIQFKNKGSEKLFKAFIVGIELILGE